MENNPTTLQACEKVCQLCPGEKIGHFSTVDIVLMVLQLTVSTGIGLYHFIREILKSEISLDDILMGGKNISIFPVVMSLTAGFMSAITILGQPTEMYNFNTSFWVAGLAMIPTYIVVNHIFIPYFHKLNIRSAYEVSQLVCFMLSMIIDLFGRVLKYCIKLCHSLKGDTCWIS